MAPYSSVDHFTFKPAPYDEGPAYLSVKIFKCWSKLAHAVTVLYLCSRAPNSGSVTWLVQRSAFGILFDGAELPEWGALLLIPI